MGNATIEEFPCKRICFERKASCQLVQNLQQLEEAVKSVQIVATSDELQLSEAKGLLEVLSRYTKSFILLNRYDSHDLGISEVNADITYEIKYEEGKATIAELKAVAGKKRSHSYFWQ